MMSKNSFLVNMKENNKRRIWLWILSGLFWFLYYPIGMMMSIGRQQTINEVRGFSEAVAKERILLAAREWLSVASNGGHLVIVSLIAAVCAIQGFSYLYYRQKVDFYHSIPVKKSRRFAVIYLNGILVFLLPYVLNLAVAMAVAGINGAMNRDNVGIALAGLPFTILLFLGNYSLTVIAVMMTGNLVITIFATLIFVLYEPVVYSLLETFRQSFYDYYSYQSANRTFYLSPIGKTMEGIGRAMETSMWTAALPQLLAVAGMTVLFTAIAWFCYWKRPAEAAGKAMAFAKTKSVVKVMLVVPAALGVGCVIKDIIGETPYAMMAFGMVMAVVIGSCVIEVIYEMDIRAAFRKKRQMLIAGVFVAAIFLTFCFDLTGFDRWTPDPAKLEDAVVIFSEDMYQHGYVDKDFKVIDVTEYFLSKPGISDIEAICELSEKKSTEERIWCEVAYRMKSGKVIWRSFSVSEEEDELWNLIMGSREYKEAKCQLYDEEIYAGMKRNRITELIFDTGFREENLPVKDLDEFREAYLKDLQKADYSMLREEFMCGRVSFTVESGPKDRTVSRRFKYDIYPSYANTLAFLEKKGVYDGNYLDAEKVASVSVTNYHSDIYEKMFESMSPEEQLSIGSREYAVTKNFYEEGQIRELLQAVYPSGFDQWWKPEGVIDADYEVIVQYKDGSTHSSYYRGSNDGGLITERIPAWLEKETAYE